MRPLKFTHYFKGKKKEVRHVILHSRPSPFFQRVTLKSWNGPGDKVTENYNGYLEVFTALAYIIYFGSG